MNDLEQEFINDQIKKGNNPLKKSGFKSFEDRQEHFENIKPKDKNQIDLFNNVTKQNKLF